MYKHNVKRIVFPLLVVLVVCAEASAQKDAKPPMLVEVKYAKSVAYSPDGSLVLIDYRLSPNGKAALGVWDTKSGEFRINMEKSTHDWERVAISPDGKKAAAINVGSREFNLWNIATGKLEETQKLPQWSRSALNSMFLVFAPDGSTVYSNWDRQMIEITLGGKNHVLKDKLDIESPGRTYFNPETKQLVLVKNVQGQKKAQLLIYDLSKEENKPQTVALDDHVASIAVSHDGKTLAMSYLRGSGKARFEVWDTDGWKLRKTFPADGRKEFANYDKLVFAPDDKTLAGLPIYSTRTDKDVDFFDLDGKVLHEFTNETFPEGIVFSPDGKTLAVKLLDANDSLLFVDPATGEVKK